MKKNGKKNLFKGNEKIEHAIYNFNREKNNDNLFAVLESIRIRMNTNGHFLVPVELSKQAIEMMNNGKMKPGAPVHVDNLNLKMRRLNLKDGKQALVAFTNKKEVEKGKPTSIISYSLKAFLRNMVNMNDIAGLVINPWGGKSLFLEKDAIKLILQVDEQSKVKSHIVFEKHSLTELNCECILDAAKNTKLDKDSIDAEILNAAGDELLEECSKLGDCKTGEVKLTKGYNLKAKNIIHTVAPVYSNSEDDRKLLEDCYWNALEIAKENDIHSIAFPSVSTGEGGYPLEEASKTAMNICLKWLESNRDYRMVIIFSCVSEEIYEAYQAIVKKNINRSAEELGKIREAVAEKKVENAAEENAEQE